MLFREGVMVRIKYSQLSYQNWLAPVQNRLHAGSRHRTVAVATPKNNSKSSGDYYHQNKNPEKTRGELKLYVFTELVVSVIHLNSTSSPMF